MGQAEKLIVNLIALLMRFSGEAIIGIILTPILLFHLGIEAYGFLMTIGASGVLLSLAMLALQSSVARELGFSLGTDDDLRLRIAFSTAFYLQIAVSVLFCSLVIYAAPYIVNKLTIPSAYSKSAAVCLILTILQFGFGIASSPFGGLLRAYQDLKTVSIVQFLFKFTGLMAALLLFLWNGDKILFYISVLFVMSIPLNLIYVFIALKRYPEAKPVLSLVSKPVLISILRYGGFTMVSFMGANLRWNGITVLMNIYYGNIVASASSIATRFAAILRGIVTLLKAALLPAMVVNTGAGNSVITERLIQLSTALVLAIAVPLGFLLFAEPEIILKLWLRQEIPPVTYIFVQLVVVSLVLSFVSTGHNIGLSARGDIGILVIISQLLIIGSFLFFAGFAIYFKQPPWWLFVGELVGVVLALCVWQPYWVIRRLNLNLWCWMRDAVLPSVLVSIVSYILILEINYFVSSGVLRLLLIALSTGLASVIIMWKLGLKLDERNKVKEIFIRRLPDFLRPA